MPPFKLEDYEPVEDRLARFWTDHPEGRVATDLVLHEGKDWVMRAEVFKNIGDSHPLATGYAHEVTGDGMVNKTSALENCETSAIGRALANAGYATKGKRPSREEMTKAASVDGSGMAMTPIPETPPAAATGGRRAPASPAAPTSEQADELSSLFESLYAADRKQDWAKRADDWAQRQYGTLSLNREQTDALLAKMRQQLAGAEAKVPA